MLTFLGYGAAFNTSLGNTSAYKVIGDKLFLIDCGSMIFHELKNRDIFSLNNIKEIVVVVTHTHSDHIGSLGDLILYGYYSLGTFEEKNVTVYAPKIVRLNEIMQLMGVTEAKYNYIGIEALEEVQDTATEIKMKAIPVNHVVELDCFAYELQIDDKKIYYSGDANDIPKNILSSLLKGDYDAFYQDVCLQEFSYNIHMPLRILKEKIPSEFRKTVHCMHLDEKFNRQEAIDAGFKIVL